MPCAQAASPGHLAALCCCSKQVHCIRCPVADGCTVARAAPFRERQQQAAGQHQLSAAAATAQCWESGMPMMGARSARSPHVLLLVLEGEGGRVVALNHRGALRRRKGQCQHEQQCGACKPEQCDVQAEWELNLAALFAGRLGLRAHGTLQAQLLSSHPSAGSQKRSRTLSANIGQAMAPSLMTSTRSDCCSPACLARLRPAAGQVRKCSAWELCRSARHLVRACAAASAGGDLHVAASGHAALPCPALPPPPRTLCIRHHHGSHDHVDHELHVGARAHLACSTRWLAQGAASTPHRSGAGQQRLPRCRQASDYQQHTSCSRMATEGMAKQRHWRTQEEGCLAHHLQQRRGGIKQLAVAWRMRQGRWQQLASVAAALVLESSCHGATAQQVTMTRCR